MIGTNRFAVCLEIATRFGLFWCRVPGRSDPKTLLHAPADLLMLVLELIASWVGREPETMKLAYFSLLDFDPEPFNEGIQNHLYVLPGL